MENRIKLDIAHSEKNRVEFFLNKVDLNLTPVSFHSSDFGSPQNIVDGFRFQDRARSVLVTVIFANSYSDADEIASNIERGETGMRCTVNGSIVFAIESSDKDLSDHLLSFFAGRE